MFKIFGIVMFIILELLFVSGFMLSCYAIVNTMVSIQYAPDFGNGCISAVSGENLCAAKALWTVVAVVLLVLAIVVPFIRSEKLKKKNRNT